MSHKKPKLQIVSLFWLLLPSFVDPWHFVTDPDLRIRSTESRIRILLFPSMTFKITTKNMFFCCLLFVDSWSQCSVDLRVRNCTVPAPYLSINKLKNLEKLRFLQFCDLFSLKTLRIRIHIKTPRIRNTSYKKGSWFWSNTSFCCFHCLGKIIRGTALRYRNRHSSIPDPPNSVNFD
jgi:hypothetical protein